MKAAHRPSLGPFASSLLLLGSLACGDLKPNTGRAAGLEGADAGAGSQLSGARGEGAVRDSNAGSTDAPPPPEADFEDVVVRVLWQGSAPTWTVNDTPVPSLVALKQSLAQVAHIKRNAPVILHPDPEVPLGNVIEVYDISRLVGFDKVQFAASL